MKNLLSRSARIFASRLIAPVSILALVAAAVILGLTHHLVLAGITLYLALTLLVCLFNHCAAVGRRNCAPQEDADE